MRASRSWLHAGREHRRSSSAHTESAVGRGRRDEVSDESVKELAARWTCTSPEHVRSHRVGRGTWGAGRGER